LQSLALAVLPLSCDNGGMETQKEDPVDETLKEYGNPFIGTWRRLHDSEYDHEFRLIITAGQIKVHEQKYTLKEGSWNKDKYLDEYFQEPYAIMNYSFTDTILTAKGTDYCPNIVGNGENEFTEDFTYNFNKGNKLKFYMGDWEKISKEATLEF
jgi:hypothetical protein